VKPDDLFIEGSNAAGGANPLGAAPASAQAVAGLGFTLQPTDIVGALTLTVDGTVPPQVSVVACRVTSTFTDEQDGVWSHVPSYDASSCVAGVVKDATVVFADVGKLVSNAALRVVLLPGPVDRIVFAKPGAGALVVTSAGAVGAGAPPLGSGVGSGALTGSGGSSSGGSQPLGGQPVGPGAVAPPPGALPGSASATGPSAVPPVVAGSVPGSTSAAQAQPAAATGGMSVDQRRTVAGIVIALEVLGFLALTSRSATTAVLPALAGGVGRFRREREGAAPRL
jgi:hypothetical protein